MPDNTPDKEQVELSPIQWMDKAIQSLYVQLPESVANDVSKRWEVVKIYLIGKVKDAFYYRDGHPRDGYLWSQFNSAHDLAASARYHQEPVDKKAEWIDDSISDTQLSIGYMQVNCFDDDSEMSLRVGGSRYQSLSVDEAKELANFIIFHIKNETEANPDYSLYTESLKQQK